ncbi:MAG: hypothetical protein PHU53_01450 [Thermoplasmata archaeon]|nr:hypothetical protein [Thermoplasmata archaeon]
MAKKKSGKKGIAKAESKVSTSDGAKPKEAKASLKKDVKKSELACQFCNRPMKDLKTKKLHERNCRPKQIPDPKPQKDPMQTAIIELKDHFEGQVLSMSTAMKVREEQHQREMEEVKTVLRMEIDRHRKELERISQVEKDVAAEKAAAVPAPPAQPPKAEEPPVQSSARQPDGRPRAIDMIPLPVPSIPRKRFEPLPEEEQIPEIGGETPAQAQKTHVQGIERAEIEALIKDALASYQPKAQTGDDIGERLDRLSEKINQVNIRADSGISNLKIHLDKVSKDVELKRIEKELEKVSERVQDIMEDSGYGESLSVTKIPPTILEIVYQAILDDIHIEIIRTKGAQDAEKIARSALEEVRLKTSGSELFKFDGRKIVTDSLAKSIESTMISAKQIQTTYDVLLEKLLETVPHHKAKNFKGMIKIKSQEFAVDRATKLTKDYSKLEKILESTNQMVAAMAANFNTRNLELHEMVREIQETTLATKADRDEIEQLKGKFEEQTERMRFLADDLALLRAELQMKGKIEGSDIPPAESEILIAPGETPMEMSGAQAATPSESAPESEPSLKVLEAVGRGLTSKSSVALDTGLDAAAVAECLDSLVAQKKILAKKSGKGVKYTTLERELEEKLKAQEPEQKPRSKKGRKGKASAEDPPVPIPEESPEPEKSAESVPEEPAAPEIIPEEHPEVISESKAKGKRKKAKPSPEEEPSPKKEPKAKKGRKWVESPPENMEESPSAEPAPITEPAPQDTTEPAAGEPAEPVTEPDVESPILMDDLPVIKKTLDELSDDERQVLDAVSEEGMTVSGIQSKLGKHIKRFALLRALRVLIDSGHVGILTKGRLELYQKINVPKMDKTKHENKQKEVK